MEPLQTSLGLDELGESLDVVEPTAVTSRGRHRYSQQLDLSFAWRNAVVPTPSRELDVHSGSISHASQTQLRGLAESAVLRDVLIREELAKISPQKCPSQRHKLRRSQPFTSDLDIDEAQPCPQPVYLRSTSRREYAAYSIPVFIKHGETDEKKPYRLGKGAAETPEALYF